MNRNNIVAIAKERCKKQQKRHKRAYKTFVSKVFTAEELLKIVYQHKPHAHILSEAHSNFLISLVTAIEIYFRDLFKTTFLLCNKDIVYEKCMKLPIAKEKMEIKIILDAFRNNLEIEDLLSANINFQNIHNINIVFSSFCDI